MQLEEIQKHADIFNEIDWEMTPEDAVTRYLEWGSSWSRGKNMVRSKSDVSYYFTISTWYEPPKIHFMKINTDEALDKDSGTSICKSVTFSEGWELAVG